MERTGIRTIIRRVLPRRIKPHRILGGRLKGKRLITSWHHYPAAILGYTEESLLTWFSSNVKPGEAWLDVGAHYGYTALALAEYVGARGRVWAFEPVLETAGYLMQTARLNQVAHLTVLPLALGAPDDVRLDRFAAVRGMAENSLPVEHSSTSVMVSRLDWLWPRVCGPSNRIDGIKIDVQGMELEVLRGMQEILKTQRPAVILELHHGVDRGDILDALKAAGYHGKGQPIESSEAGSEPMYADDRSYVFLADAS